MKRIATFHDLAGQSVFITGGGSGIGACLTDAFMSQGAKVAFVQRSDASVFCQEMEKKHGQKPLFLACDITNISALKDTIQKASDAHGPITTLINNAANDKRHKTEDVSEEFWDWSLAINLKSYFFACQAVIKDMKEAGGGSIINMTSISYMMGNSGYPAYTTGNSGINGMTRSLAREFGPNNIRVNALAPGWVMTEKQITEWVTEDALEQHMGRQCLGEALKPDDIVDTALFLASKTSRMMTGQALVVDGGVVVTG
jgi:NAD(P)-dependent dehydrogenase (short-subunit alcohol dehydrogenase family)